VGNLILLLPNLPPSKEKLESGISCEISGFLINNCSKKKKVGYRPNRSICMVSAGWGEYFKIFNQGSDMIRPVFWWKMLRGNVQELIVTAGLLLLGCSTRG
jgi:hypothetical protein